MKSLTVAALAGIAAAKVCTPMGGAQRGIHASYYEWDNSSNIEPVDFTNRSPVATQVVPYVNVNAGGGIIGNSGRSDLVAAVYDTWVQLEAGTYTWGLTSDDGSVLYIDDQLVVNNDTPHGPINKEAQWTAPEDGMYKLQVKFFENFGGMNIIIFLDGVILDGSPSGRCFTPESLECMEDMVCTGEACCQGERDPMNNCECPALPEVDWDASFDAVSGQDSWADVLAMCRGDNTDAASAFANEMFNKWFANKADTCQVLPKVCESGQECRDGIWAAAKQTMTNDWSDVLDRVCDKIIDSWNESKRILTEGYKEEFVCEAGCYCEEIEETYIDHIRLRNEIEREIDDIQTEVRDLIQKQNDVLTNCPDYEATRYVVDAQYLD